MTRKCRTHGDLKGFLVTHLTNHHHVRVLTQNASKGGSEGHADLASDGNLIDTSELIFDRVLDGNNVVKHAELVPEIGQEPDYDKALAAL